MKILQEGKLPGNRAYRSQCRNCGTKFEFTALEATLVPDQRDGDYLEIRCPLAGCGQVCVAAAGR